MATWWRGFVASGRDGRVALVAAAPLGLAAFAWLVADDRSAAATGEAAVEPVETVARGPAARLSISRLPPPVASTETADAGVEKVEVCGVGWVEVRADGSVDLDAIHDTPALEDARRALGSTTATRCRGCTS